MTGNPLAAASSAAGATSLSVASQQTVSQVETQISQGSTIEAPPPPPPVQDALNLGTTSTNPSNGTEISNQNGGSGTAPTTVRGNPIPDATNTSGGQRATGSVVIIIKRPS